MEDRGVLRLLGHRWLWVGMLVAFPLVDYVLRNVLVIPVVSSVWDDGLLVVLAAMALWIFLGEEGVFVPQVKRALVALLVFAAAMLVLDMGHFDVSLEGFRAQFQYMIALFVGFYLLRAGSPKAIKLEHLLVAMVGVAALVALYGVYQYVVGAPMPAGWVDASESMRTRAYSFVQSPNILGAYMALMAPIAIGLFFAQRDKKWLKLVWLGVALLLVATLVFTGSRGAWLAFAAGIGLLVAFLDKRIFIVFLVGVVLVGAFVPSVTSRITQLASPSYLEKSTNDGRIARWTNAFDKVRSNPVFGVGMGHYGGAVGARHFNTTYVDSYVFKTAAETGLLGLGLFAWLIGTIFRSIHRYWRGLVKVDRSRFYQIGGVYAGLIAVIFHNGVENIFEMPFMNLFWWLLAGAVLAATVKGGNNTDVE